MYKPQPKETIGEYDNSIDALCTAILIQAIVDYKDWQNKSALSLTDISGKYTKNEISRFFQSEWCSILLRTIGCRYTGEQILEMIKIKSEKSVANSEGRKIGAFNKAGELIQEFNTLQECASFAKLKSTADICRCCSGLRSTAGGYFWKYI